MTSTLAVEEPWIEGGGGGGDGGAFIEPSIVDEFTRGLEWHGHFQTYAALGARRRFGGDFLILDNRLQIDLESKVADFHLVARPQLVFDLIDGRLDVRFREVFAARYFRRLDIEFGERIVTWGVTDFYPVVDVVNPRDLSSVRRWWPIDDKLAVPMVTMTAIFEPVTVQALVILLSRRSKLELDQNQPFAVPIILSDSSIFEEHEVPRTIGGSGAGAKINLELGRWTIAAYGLLGRDPINSVYIDVDPISLDPRTNTINERIFMSALSVQGTLGAINSVVRAEAAHFVRIDDPCADNPRRGRLPDSQLYDCAFVRHVPTVRASAGIENKPFASANAQLQLIAELTREDDIDLPHPALVPESLRQKTINPLVSARLDLRLFDGDLQPKSFFVISLADENFFVNLDVEYHLGDSMAFALGGFWFEGYSNTAGKNRYTPFGAFEDSSHVYLRLTAWY